ncbi:MAG: portal protein, partial [Aeromonas veronii]
LRIEYVLVDYDGDGIAERRLIHRLEGRILSNEETDHVQIATTSPVLNPHRWDGMSIAEAVADIQRLKTDLTRSLVNAANLAVNPRKTVLTDINGNPLVNVDDLLDFRIGGIVRQSRSDALGMEPMPFNGQAMLPVLAYVDEMAEKRTGVSKQQQGLDSNALRTDRTAAEVMMTANAAKQRVKLIARIFAETLVKPVFQGVLKLLTAGEMEPLAFRLRGEFVRYDPNEWRDQYDMTTNVGLGTGDKQQQIAFFQNLMQMQMGLAQSPFGQLLIDPQKIYNTVAKMVELGGQKNVGDFIGDPQGRPLQPPGPPPQLAIEQAKMQQQGQLKQMDLQYKAQADDLQRRQPAELELIRQQAQQQTDANRQAMEAQMHRMKLEQEAQLDALR